MVRPINTHLHKLIAQGVRPCSGCNQIKPLDEFPKASRQLGGVATRCKECAHKYQRERYTKKRDKILDYFKTFYQENKQVYFERTKQYRAEGRYHDKELDYGRQYNASEHGKQVRQTYNHSEARRESSKRWSKEHPERKQAVWHVWNARRKGILVKPEQCEKCGAKTDKIHAHHYLGYAKEHRLDVQWLCVSCHVSAHHSLS